MPVLPAVAGSAKTDYQAGVVEGRGVRPGDKVIGLEHQSRNLSYSSSFKESVARFASTVSDVSKNAAAVSFNNNFSNKSLDLFFKYCCF